MEGVDGECGEGRKVFCVDGSGVVCEYYEGRGADCGGGEEE